MRKEKIVEICEIEAHNLGVEFLEILSFSSNEIEWVYLEEGQEIQDLIYL